MRSFAFENQGNALVLASLAYGVLLGFAGGCVQGSGGEQPLAQGSLDTGQLGFDCPDGGIDLAARSSADGFTLISLGPQALTDNGTTVFDEVDLEGDGTLDPVPVGDIELVLCVPNNTVSFVLHSDDDTIVPRSAAARSLFTSFVTPSEDELIGTVNSADYLFTEARPSFDGIQSLSSIAHPKSPDRAPVGGVYRVKLAATTLRSDELSAATSTDFSVAIRRGNPDKDASLGMRVVIVEGSDVAAEEVAHFEDNLVSELNGIFAGSGFSIDPKRFEVGFISDPEYSVVRALRSEVRALTSAEITDKDGNILPPAPEGSTVHVYLTDQILDPADSSVIFALASGIPGAVGFPASKGSGVFMSVSAMRFNQNAIFLPILHLAMAHEVGHWLGLHHTTERNGIVMDLLPDTPSCPAANDTAGAPGGGGDGLVSAGECLSRDGTNLMFWNAEGTSITPGQARLLKWNPIAAAGGPSSS